MKKSEVATLLAFCAAYDQRTLGEADVEAWAEALDSPWVPNIDLDEAQSAVVAHYRETSQRINVADILKRVKTDRADRLSRGMPPRRPGTPPTEEYRKARAELEERLRRRKPEGAA
jgi:hypothetical protein